MQKCTGSKLDGMRIPAVAERNTTQPIGGVQAASLIAFACSELEGPDPLLFAGGYQNWLPPAR